MYYDNPFVEPVDNWLTVWVGELNEDELDEYLEEEGGVDDVEPISKFCRDLGRWYDHDFIWMEGVDVAISIKELCDINGIESQDLTSEIERRSPLKSIKSLLILWNSRIVSDNATHVFSDGKLICIGSWEHESPLTD